MIAVLVYDEECSRCHRSVYHLACSRSRCVITLALLVSCWRYLQLSLPAIRGCIPRWIGRYGSADALKLALLRSTRNGFHCRWHSPSSMPSSPTCEERCYSSVVPMWFAHVGCRYGPRLPVFGVTTTFSVISWRVVSDGSVLRAFAGLLPLLTGNWALCGSVDDVDGWTLSVC